MRFLGVIAEDKSDVEVVDTLARKIARAKFTVRSAIGHGCGRLQGKALSYAHQLRRERCSLLMLVCDLDQNSLADLSSRLRHALQPCPIDRHVVVIPVQEMEAWLLADHDAVSDAFKLHTRLKKQPNPEGIQHPKERLRDLIEQRSRRRVRYVSAVHNRLIARHARLEQLRRCASFTGFEKFVRTHLG